MAKAQQKYKDNEKYCNGISQKVYADLLAVLSTFNIDSVALISGVHYTTIYSWLDGRTQSPRLYTLLKVARAIGYDIVLVKTDKQRHLRSV